LLNKSKLQLNKIANFNDDRRHKLVAVWAEYCYKMVMDTDKGRRGVVYFSCLTVVYFGYFKYPNKKNDHNNGTLIYKSDLKTFILMLF